MSGDLKHAMLTIGRVFYCLLGLVGEELFICHVSEGAKLFS